MHEGMMSAASNLRSVHTHPPWRNCAVFPSLIALKVTCFNSYHFNINRHMPAGCPPQQPGYFWISIHFKELTSSDLHPSNYFSGKYRQNRSLKIKRKKLIWMTDNRYAHKSKKWMALLKILSLPLHWIACCEVTYSCANRYKLLLNPN